MLNYLNISKLFSWTDSWTGGGSLCESTARAARGAQGQDLFSPVVKDCNVVWQPPRRSISLLKLLHSAIPTGSYQALAQWELVYTKCKSLHWRARRKHSPQTTSALAPSASEVSHPVTKEALGPPLFSMWFPLGCYTQRGCMCWSKLGIQGAWWIELRWMKYYCSQFCILSLAENTFRNSPTSCTAHMNAPQYALVHTNSRHLLKLLKQTQLILLRQSREFTLKPSCQQSQLLSERQLITNAKRAVMSYSGPAFLWANVHRLLLMHENNVLFNCFVYCLLKK